MNLWEDLRRNRQVFAALVGGGETPSPPINPAPFPARPPSPAGGARAAVPSGGPPVTAAAAGTSDGGEHRVYSLSRPPVEAAGEPSPLENPAAPMRFPDELESGAEEGVSRQSSVLDRLRSELEAEARLSSQLSGEEGD